MNNLVDYGSDSDEEQVTSPSQKNDTLNEVAPGFNGILYTKSIVSSSLTLSNSQNSLVYMERSEIYDDFENNFDNLSKPLSYENKQFLSSDLVEPQPPKRPNDESDKLDCSPDESDVDTAVKEGMSVLKFMEIESNTDNETQKSTSDFSSDDITPKQTTKTVDLPLSPIGECATEVANKFIAFFDLKAKGMKMNEKIKSHKNFKNPALYEFLVKEYDIDEKGTNFQLKIFNPHRFKKEDFYDELAKEQHKLHEKMVNAVEAKKPTSTPFTQLPPKRLTENLGVSKPKKTRFNVK